MNRFQKIISLGLLTAAFATPSFSASVVPPADITSAQEIVAIGHSSPLYKAQNTDKIAFKSITSNDGTNFDNAQFGTLTISAPRYVFVDSSNQINLTLGTATNGGSVTTWESYRSGAIAATYNATTTIDVTQTLSNGAAATTKILKLTFAKTGTPPDITRTQITNFLRGLTTITYAANTAGTTLVGAPALPAGWAARAYLDNGSGTAILATLEPLECTFTQSITPAGGTALTFTGAMTGMYDSSWNVATNSTATKDLTLVTTSGAVLTWTLALRNLVRDRGIASAVVEAFATPPSKRINTTSGGLANALANGVSENRALLVASPSTDEHSIQNTLALKLIQNAGFAAGDFTSTILTSDFGAVALTPSNIQDLTWRADGTKIIANGRVGTSGALKDFVCDVGAFGTAQVDSTNNSVLQFTAKDNHSFWIKAFVANGGGNAIDGTVGGAIPGASDNSVLAILASDTFSAFTAINKLSLDEMIDAL